MADKLLDIQQVAEYLQMNKITVYKLARSGKIPAFKVASEWRFKKDMLDAWLNSRMSGRPDMEKLVTEALPEQGSTVLVVDDEAVIRDFFTRTLKDYKVLTAGTGEEAVDLVRKRRPDLVLLDLKMPGIDGIETLMRIKEIDRSMPVVMLSAHGTIESNMEAARLGAFASMAKPFDLSHMLSMIRTAILGEKEE